jgi:hypothetical protein
MTLLIAWLIIAGFEMHPLLYFIAFIFWVLHLMAHSKEE